MLDTHETVPAVTAVVTNGEPSLDQNAGQIQPAPGRNTFFEFSFRPKTVARCVLAFASVVVLVGLLANIGIYRVAPSPDHRIAKALSRFDLGMEPSIPAWYSSIALLCCAILLATIGLTHRKKNDQFSVHWLVLSLLFVLLSIDESVMFHEMLILPLREAFDTHGVFYFPWLIPGAAFVALVGACYLRFLKHLVPRTRWLFVTAAVIFVSGAIGMELIAGVVIEKHGVAATGHIISQFIEESLEMLGVIVFIFALLDYIQNQLGVQRLRLSLGS
jgi:hypothetical protein